MLDGIQNLYNAMQEISKGTGDFSRNLQIIAASPLALEAAQQVLEDMKPQSTQGQMSKEFLLQGLDTFRNNLQQAFPDLLQSPVLWRDRHVPKAQAEEPAGISLKREMHRFLFESTVFKGGTPIMINDFFAQQIRLIGEVKNLRNAFVEKDPHNTAVLPLERTLDEAQKALKDLHQAIRRIANGTPAESHAEKLTAAADIQTFKTWFVAVSTYRDALCSFWDGYEIIKKDGVGKQQSEDIRKLYDHYCVSMTNEFAPLCESIGSPLGRA